MLTPEQQAVVDALSTSENEPVAVQAFAGTGKTTTLRHLAEALRGRRVLYLAFNRAIAEEARRRFPRHVAVMTTHALAYRLTKTELKLDQVRGNYRALELQELLQTDWRTAFAVAALLEGWMQSDADTLDEGVALDLLRQNALLARRLRATLGVRLHDWPISLKELTERALWLWDMMLTGHIAPTHSVYLKYCQLERHRLVPRADVLLLDEAQDTNPVTLSILMATGARLVAVGDSHQQIYAFRGSVDALPRIGGRRYYLTRSWRLSETIAREANRLLHRFKGEQQRIVGGHTARDGCRDLAFIGRTNAGLIQQAAVMLEAGFDNFRFLRPVDEIFSLALALQRLRRSWRSEKAPELPTRYAWLAGFGSDEDLLTYAEETHDVELASAWQIATRFGRQLGQLARRLAELAPQRRNAPVVLTTAHTAKGLEWDRVVVLEDFPDLVDLMLGELPERSFQEEVNLLYVAYTRARRRLEDRTLNGYYITLSDRDFQALVRERQRKLQKQHLPASY